MSPRALASLGLAMAFPAQAMPEGAPWGTANPDHPDACASCHWDYLPVLQSSAITMDGLPDRIVPGTIYDLTLTFAPEGAQIAGFAAMIRAGDQPAGQFVAGDGQQARGHELRSVQPLPVTTAPARWTFRWQAPDQLVKDISLLIAANATNDDQSPLGDQVHQSILTLGRLNAQP